MNTRILGAWTFAAGGVLSLIAGQAGAQSVEGSFELQEIIVTATKVATNLQDTPMTVTAIDGERVQESGRSSLTQILQDIPGVQANTAGNFGSYFWIRGIGSSPTFGQDTAVTTSINGVFQQTAQSTRGTFFDIQRVEVARGPQSTLTGRNSLAGAVAVITNEPTVEDFHAEGTLGFGSYNLINTQGMINAPIGSRVAVRGAFSTEKRNGLLTNGSSDSDLQAVRLRVLFQPTDDLKIILSGERNKTTGKGVGSADTGLFVPSQNSELTLGRYCTTVTQCATAVTSTQAAGPGFANLPFVTNPYNTAAPYSPYQRGYDAKTYYADLNWNMGWAKLFFQPTSMVTDAVDYNATFSPLQYALWSERVTRLAPTMPVQQQEQVARALATGINWTHIHQEQKSFELRLSSPDESKLQWFGGLYWFENAENTRTSVSSAGVVGTYQPGTAASYCLPNPCLAAPTAQQPVAIAPNAVGVTRTIDSDPTLSDVLTALRPGVDPNRNTTDKAVYGQVVWPFTDSLKLTVGARYTREEKERLAEDPIQLRRTYFEDNFGPATGASQIQYIISAATQTWNLFDYRVTLDYKFTPQTMVYGSVSTGFRGGNFQNLGPGTARIQGTNVTQLTTPFQTLPGFSTIYDPERLTAYEVGTRNDLFNKRLRLNASVYYYDYRDYQYQYTALPWSNIDPDAGLAYTTNAGKATSYGLDIESSFLLTPHDQLGLNAAYINATLGQLTLPGGTAAAVADGNSLNGQPLRRAPKWSGGPRYSHIFDLGDRGRITASADLHYESDSYVNNYAPLSQANGNRFALQQSYHRSNASLSYDTSNSRFNISVFARNLEDEITVGTVGGATFSATQNNQVQNLTWDPGEGRTYGVTISARL